VRQYLKEPSICGAVSHWNFEDYLWNAPYARCAEKTMPQPIEWLKSLLWPLQRNYIDSRRQMANLLCRDIRHVLLLHLGAFEDSDLPRLLDFMKNLLFKFVTLGEAEKSAIGLIRMWPLRMEARCCDQMMEAKHIRFPQNEKPYAATQLHRR